MGLLEWNGSVPGRFDPLPALLRLDFIGVSSYGQGTASGLLTFTKELRLDVRGRDILLVDDILDTGRTMKAVRDRLSQLAARASDVCAPQ
ncbi:MAG: phosphoribosyltransferase family protein [Verrucomicrobiota bacterium]